MTAPVSVIIPTLDAADRLGPCLGAVGEGALSGLIHEVVLVDGGSNDAIAEVAEAVGARLVTAPRGRGTQLAAGADAARAEWFLFLHADSVLPKGWPARLQSHLETRADKAGYFNLGFSSDTWAARWIAGWANLRSRVFALPYGDQGLFVSRRLYHDAGGFLEIPLMEDVALARALGRGRLHCLGGEIITSSERYERDGWFTRGRRNLSVLVLYFLGVSPEKLYLRYQSR